MKLILLFTAALTVISLPSFAGESGFNHKGNILISDQFNNRVIEVDPTTHAVVWQFGTGSSVAGPTTVVAVNDAERVGGGLTLMSGTGTPPGATPDCPNGCPDNRVMLVNEKGSIVWQYGQAGITGSGPDQLNAPVCSVFLPKGVVLITDQGNQRIIAVTLQKKIVWQYGMTGVTGSGFNQLNNPNSAELLANGDVLIADESNNRVIEVNPHNNLVVWSYATGLSAVAFASRLDTGNTLITDQNNNRIIEVDMAGTIVWQYTKGGAGMNSPTRAIRLSNGNTIISDQNNQQVFEINPAQQIVFAQGMLGVIGSGFDMLYAPYDAKVIGDYTGITPPSGDFE